MTMWQWRACTDGADMLYFLKERSTNFTHDQFKYQQLEDYKYLIWSLQYKLRSVAFEREALTG